MDTPPSDRTRGVTVLLAVLVTVILGTIAIIAAINNQYEQVKDMVPYLLAAGGVTALTGIRRGAPLVATLALASMLLTGCATGTGEKLLRLACLSSSTACNVVCHYTKDPTRCRAACQVLAAEAARRCGGGQQ